MSYVVGLTGGIGSGKSMVAALFAERGAALVDADQVAHELTAPGGAALPALRAEFGDGVLQADGSLDRQAMRRIVFSDPAAKARLEAILHPMIRAACDARCAAAREAPYVVLVVPLLVESGVYADRIDRLLVVDCPEALQVQRVMARSGLSADEIRRIMSTQATREARLRVADDVLLNDRSPADVLQPVAELHAFYCAQAFAAREKKPKASR